MAYIAREVGANDLHVVLFTAQFVDVQILHRVGRWQLPCESVVVAEAAVVVLDVHVVDAYSPHVGAILVVAAGNFLGKQAVS